ncbi:hypothetical protein AAG906_025899 [Vitis piasezkii]
MPNLDCKLFYPTSIYSRSIMGTTISIENNNGPIYACCNRLVFPLIISVFKSLVYGGRSFDFQELKSTIHQVFSVPTVFASTRGGAALAIDWVFICQNHCLGIGRTSSRRGEEAREVRSLSFCKIEDSHRGSWEFARRNRQTCVVLQVSYESGFLMIVMKFVGYQGNIEISLENYAN